MDVKQVVIDVHVPSDKVRVVVMQPFNQLQAVEPFQWLVDKDNEQLKAIRLTLDLAQKGFREGIANFTLFPEYSIPGLAGASIIDERIKADEWPNDNVIIGGLHGLTKAEYGTLCQQLAVNLSDSDAPDSVPNNKWVNCCIIWVKERDGRVQKWAQLKIRPSWAEMNVVYSDMFCGSTVYVFKTRYAPNGYPCNFTTFICYDWVAAHAGSTVCEQVLSQLNEQWNGTPTPLHWVFVIQHNPQPNSESFLTRTKRFFTDNTCHFVDRYQAVVLLINTAISIRPSRGRNGAFTACVFSPTAPFMCDGGRPTVCMEPTILRGSDILNRCKEAVFREMGNCVHLFKVRVPCFVTSDPTDKTYPILDAEVHAVAETDDPRLCGAEVPAALKRLNDYIDCVNSLAQTAFAHSPFQADVEHAHQSIVSKMRMLDGKNAADCINLAACAYSNESEFRNGQRFKNADLWDQLEENAFEHVIHSLASLGITYDLDFSNNMMHGALNLDLTCVQVIAIRGKTYTDCRLHYDNNVISKLSNDPVLVIARDQDNLKAIAEEFLKYYETDKKRDLVFLDYQSLITYCREAKDKETLRRCLDEFIPTERPIV